MIRALPLLASLVFLIGSAGGQETADEAKYWQVDWLTAPQGQRLEVAGLAFLPGDRLLVGTRRGQVWLVDDALAADPRQARFKLFCEGLQEVLGIHVDADGIFVLQRSELSRLVDADGDDVAERVETVCNAFGVSGNYHEFAFGLPRDDLGQFWITLNVSFFSPKWWHGKSPVPYRGWALKIAPNGTMTPVAPGLRSPCGIGRNKAGDIFVTDNQGDWVPACPIWHVKDEPGRFYGHPASLDWTSAWQAEGRHATDTDPPDVRRADAAVWIPYEWSRSAGNPVSDDTGGRFGPFDGQLFVAEMTNGLIVRSALEKVRGEWQGAAFMFRRNVGSAIRTAFAPDGSLFCGLSNRGWGGQKPDDGVARLRWRGVMPMEMTDVKVLDGGFDVGFTLPISTATLPTPATVALRQYDYDWWWEYGSPERNNRSVEVTAVEVSGDRRRVILRAPDLKAGMVARGVFKGVQAEDGARLLHDEFAYTLNQFPNGPRCEEQVAKLVAPPTPRESGDEGWLFLCAGDALAAWQGTGWQAGRFELSEDKTAIVEKAADAEPPAADATRPEWKEGPRPQTIAAIGEAPVTDLIGRLAFGDIRAQLKFYLPKGGRSGVLFMGRYEILLTDTADGSALTISDCGGIDAVRGTTPAFAGRAPTFDAYRGPGQWHDLDVTFSAPTFDATGRKTADACFQRVMINDTLLQEVVVVHGPTAGAVLQGEAPTGPLVLRGAGGPVAFSEVRIRALNVAPDDGGRQRIFDGKTLEGWKITDAGNWQVEDGAIVGRGERSHLFSPRSDYRDFEWRARVKINDGGNSGMYFRVAFGPEWPAGYEAQVNSTNRDPVKSGSLYSRHLLETALVPPGVWFVQSVSCGEESGGTRVIIRINDVVVTDFLDVERRFAAGHLAFQQHHDGSVVHFKDVEVRER